MKEFGSPAHLEVSEMSIHNIPRHRPSLRRLSRRAPMLLTAVLAMLWALLPAGLGVHADSPSPAAAPPVVEDGGGTKGAPVGDRYLVFVDDLFAIPAHRDPILRALAGQIDILDADDRVALTAFDGRRATRLSGWTRSAEQWSAALDAARERSGYGLRQMTELRRSGSIRRDRFSSGGGGFSRIGFSGSARQLTSPGAPRDEGFDERVGGVARAVEAALDEFFGDAAPAATPRRVLLLLTGGWPLGDDGPTDRDRDVEALGPRRYQALDPIVEAARRHGVAVFPVDLETLDAHATLGHLAAMTGGRALLHGNAARALELAAEASIPTDHD